MCWFFKRTKDILATNRYCDANYLQILYCWSWHEALHYYLRVPYHAPTFWLPRSRFWLPPFSWEGLYSNLIEWFCSHWKKITLIVYTYILSIKFTCRIKTSGKYIAFLTYVTACYFHCRMICAMCRYIFWVSMPWRIFDTIFIIACYFYIHIYNTFMYTTSLNIEWSCWALCFDDALAHILLC